MTNQQRQFALWEIESTIKDVAFSELLPQQISGDMASMPAIAFINEGIRTFTNSLIRAFSKMAEGGEDKT